MVFLYILAWWGNDQQWLQHLHRTGLNATQLMRISSSFLTRTHTDGVLFQRLLGPLVYMDRTSKRPYMWVVNPVRNGLQLQNLLGHKHHVLLNFPRQ